MYDTCIMAIHKQLHKPSQTSNFRLTIVTHPCLFVRFLLKGMVTIGSPQTTVCYQSSPMLICTFEEATSSAKWTMSTGHKSFELNNGSIIQLNHSCSTEEYKSCVAVTLHKVTGIVAGKYKCFTFYSDLCTHFCLYDVSIHKQFEYF